MRTPKFSVRDVAAIQQKLARGASLRDLSQELETSVVTLLKIKKGQYQPNERENARDQISIQQDLFNDSVDSRPSVQQAESHSTD